MPSADFCTAVRVPHDTPSSIWNTAQTSRGKNISLHRTPAEFTTPALDGYGLHDHLLTRPAGIASYPVPVRQATILLHASSRPRLTTTPLRFTNPSPPSGWVEDFHLQANIHARHTKKAAGGSPAAFLLWGESRDQTESKRTRLSMNLRRMLPVGPFRCFAMMISAMFFGYSRPGCA